MDSETMETPYASSSGAMKYVLANTGVESVPLVAYALMTYPPGMVDTVGRLLPRQSIHALVTGPHVMAEESVSRMSPEPLRRVLLVVGSEPSIV